MNFHESENVEVNIYDIKGSVITREIISYNGSRKIEKINISEFENGIYTLKVISNEEVYSRKVVKVN